MSTAKVEDAQPEPVSSTTQETTKMEEDTPATKIEDGDVKSEVKNAKKNGTEKKEKNGPPTYENGILKTTVREDVNDRSKNSKYDPSVLPETDDPKLIRNQVTIWNLNKMSNNY
jgi:lupus La protein